jgi:hypothetical protein
LLSSSNLAKIVTSQATYGPRAYQLIDFLDDLDEGMWTELTTFESISLYRRNLQRSYIDRLLELATSTRSDREYRDVAPIIIIKLGEIQQHIKKGMLKIKDVMSIYHLRYIDNKITVALADKHR